MVDNHERSDVIIIGGGPAGLTALMWCRELGLNSIVLEAGAGPGGQLHRIFNPINNYPGIQAATGAEFYEKFTLGFEQLKGDILLNRTVTEVDVENCTVTVDDEARFAARALVFATGVRRRKLGIQGENEFTGRGILESGAKQRQAVEDRVVAIVGSGDAALENAVILSEFAKKVLVIHRRKELSARTSFVADAAARGNVEFLPETVVSAIKGSETVEQIEVSEADTGRSKAIEVDQVLIRIGVEPNSEMLKGKVELDEFGYVRTDLLGRTTIHNIFAVGDVANPVSPTIVSAAGSGATAAKAIAKDLSRGA